MHPADFLKNIGETCVKEARLDWIGSKKILEIKIWGEINWRRWETRMEARGGGGGSNMFIEC